MKTETTKKCLFCQSEFSTKSEDIICDTCQTKAQEVIKGITAFVSNIAFSLEAEIKKGTENFEKAQNGNSSDLIKRRDDFWTFSHAALWPYENFGEQAEQYFKSEIAKFFTDEQANDQTFLNLVERCISNYLFFEGNPIEIEFSPAVWLIRNDSLGLSGVDSPRRIKTCDEIRIDRGTRMFAKEILSYSLTNDLVRLSSFRNTLIQENQTELLPLFYRVVYYFQFNSTTLHF